MKVSIDQIGIEVANIISEYTESVKDGIQKEINESAENLKNAISDSAPKDRPKYAKGFKIKKEDKKGYSSRIIYNAELPGLAHLKELGHVKRGGKGRVAAQPHIRPSYDSIEPKFLKHIENIIKNGG